MFAASPLRKIFYWTGGTALAFHYFCHRMSYDLDFFSASPFRYQDVSSFAHKAAIKFRLKLVEKKIHDRWDFLLTNGKELRFEFAFYNFRALKPKILWRGIRIDSLDDMAANKTMAMIDRKDPKDVYDVYSLIHKAGYAPEKLLSLAYKKFGARFHKSLFWGEGLQGAKSLDSLRPLLFGKEEDGRKAIQAVKDYFERGAADFARIRIE